MLWRNRVDSYRLVYWTKGLQFLESGQGGERLTFDRLQRIAAHFEKRQLRHLLEEAGFDVGDMIVAQVPAHTIWTASETNQACNQLNAVR